MYGSLCIKFPQSRMKGERYEPLVKSFFFKRSFAYNTINSVFPISSSFFTSVNIRKISLFPLLILFANHSFNR